MSPEKIREVKSSSALIPTQPDSVAMNVGGISVRTIQHNRSMIGTQQLDISIVSPEFRYNSPSSLQGKWEGGLEPFSEGGIHLTFLGSQYIFSQ